MAFWVYIVASNRNGTLYIGQTDSLNRRIWEHKTKTGAKFTSDYSVNKLVWYERHDTRASARLREDRIKKWNRAWKLRVIEEMNPDWRDLYEELSPLG